MSSTELAQLRDKPAVHLFPGATTADVIAAATDVSEQFSKVVKAQRMFKRIGDHDHIQVEAWQTIGALTNVFAVEAEGVRELLWPTLAEPGDEPDAPGTEPRDRKSAAHAAWKFADRRRRAWESRVILAEQQASGGAFGYAATYRAVRGDQEIGWAEGRCDRTEPNWADRDNYSLASMAQTRGQSRALAAPLRFVVKLAGYEGTPAEELDGTGAPGTNAQVEQLRADLEQAQARAITFADESSYLEAMAAARGVRPDLDAGGLIAAMVRAFKFGDAGLPEVVARSLRIFKWWADQAAEGNERAIAPDEPVQGAVTDAEVVEGDPPSEADPAAQEPTRRLTEHEIEQHRLSTYHQGGPRHQPPAEPEGAPE